MPRIRYLKPEFFSDEDLAELPFETRLTFAGLWCFADREGRLEDRPKFLKAMIFPYDKVDIEEHLNILCRPKSTNGIPFIIRYKSDHIKLIEIINWHKHQKPHHTEKPSVFPPGPSIEEKESNKEKEENIKIMGMGMEKQNEASRELRNGSITVKRRLKKIDEYNCLFFKEFWKCYPKKIGKGKAWEEWNKISIEKDENLIKKMITVINQFKITDQWQKNNGQYIPNPATWLHQKRWEDEIEVKKDKW